MIHISAAGVQAAAAKGGSGADAARGMRIIRACFRGSTFSAVLPAERRGHSWRSLRSVSCSRQPAPARASLDCATCRISRRKAGPRRCVARWSFRPDASSTRHRPITSVIRRWESTRSSRTTRARSPSSRSPPRSCPIPTASATTTSGGCFRCGPRSRRSRSTRRTRGASGESWRKKGCRRGLSTRGLKAPGDKSRKIAVRNKS